MHRQADSAYCTTQRGSEKTWLCLQLPVTGYRDAWKLQSDLVAARKRGTLDTNVVVFLEHFPVFTLGRRGGLDDLRVSEDLLQEAGIPVIHVERGGHITFHGPGQIVMYPILDLRDARLNVADYVGCLEEVMIRTAADWGIRAGRNPLNRGVWVGDRKLGSIGIAIRRGICFHGAAFNVNLRLKPFGWIHPCGLQDTKMTSIARELACRVPMSQVRRILKHHFQAVFGIELIATDLSELGSMLATDSHRHFGRATCSARKASSTEADRTDRYQQQYWAPSGLIR